MQENKNFFSGEEDMELHLWNYIDGIAEAKERTAIEKLIAENAQWHIKYSELLEVHQILNSTELEQPSLRFTKNVMEEISKLHIAPAAKDYINKKIIWGIAAFFITIILGMLVYLVGQISWSTGSADVIKIDFGKLNYSKVYSSTFVNIFMMLNIVLALMLLDKYLSNKRKKLTGA